MHVTSKHTRAAALLALTLAAPLPAAAAIEESYEQDNSGPPLTTWYVSADPASVKADRDYVAGMRPHHAGALTMARDYLDDPASSSPVLRVLAQAIIRNQSFEVSVLDEVGRNLDLPPTVINLGFVCFAIRPAATEGIAQRQRFFHSPIPSLLDGFADPGAPITERDVQFAKAMTIHHQAAVDMARDYHANPDARNGFLGLMNIDIDRDQTNEIALMRRVIALYPGNADAVKVDASMIHGMEGMSHGGGHGGHEGMVMPAQAREAAPPQEPPAARQRPAAQQQPAPQRRAAPRKAAPAAEDHSGHEHHKH